VWYCSARVVLYSPTIKNHLVERLSAGGGRERRERKGEVVSTEERVKKKKEERRKKKEEEEESRRRLPRLNTYVLEHFVITSCLQCNGIVDGLHA
jgi:antirestriction protein ArdC